MRNNDRDTYDIALEENSRAAAALIIDSWENGNRNYAAVIFQECSYPVLVAALVARYFIEACGCTRQDIIDGIRFLAEHTTTPTN